MKRPTMSKWLSVSLKAVAVFAFVAAFLLVAPSASAQTCANVDLSQTGTHYTTINGQGQTVPLSYRNFNALALIFRAAGRDQQGFEQPAGCVQLAAIKLREHLIDTRRKTGAQMWQQWLAGGYVVFVMAAGMEISGRGYMSEELDLLIRDVGEDYRFVKYPGDPCGIWNVDPTAPVAGLKYSRRANSCMDDYAMAAAGYSFKAAYWRLSTRHYQSSRSSAISAMRNALLDNESICVHSPSLWQSDMQKVAAGQLFEADPCNRTESDLDAGGDAVVISLNHGNQTPAYGFGLIASIAGGAAALEVTQHPLSPAGEFSPNENKALKYLWKEIADHTTPQGAFHSQTTSNPSCYNMTGSFDGSRKLVTGWGCEDQQGEWGDPSEGTGTLPTVGEIRGYDARWYGLGTFYDRYGIAKVTGNGYSFATFQDPNNRFNYYDPNLDLFFGVARYETYNTLASKWFTNRPPLSARSEFRLSINTYNTSGGRYFYATNGGGSTLVVSGASSGATNTNFEIVDLNGAVLETGDRVAVRVTNTAGQAYYLTVPSSGGTVSATATSHTATTAQFYMEKITTSPSPGTLISSHDYFMLKSVASGKYVEAVNGGGSNVVASTSVASNYARFRFIKTELPRRVY